MTDDGLATAAVDADGVVVGWSVQARSLLGYPPAEVIGRPAANLLAVEPQDSDRKAAEAQEPWAGEVTVRRRDGRHLDVQLRAHPMQDAGGRTQWFLSGTAVGRRFAARRPQVPGPGDVRALLDWAFAQAPVNLALLDTDARHLRMNDGLCRTLGIEEEHQALGRVLTDVFSGPVAEAVQAWARDVARSGEPAFHHVVTMSPGESSDHAWSIIFSPVTDPAGQVRGVLVVGLDVTEQYQTRQRLALVNDASTRIGSTLDVTRTAEELIDVTVPQLADYVAVDLLDSVLRGDEPTPGPVAGTVALRRMAIGSILENTPETARRPGQVSSYPSGSPAAHCLETGQATLCQNEDITAGWVAKDPVRVARVQWYGFHSVIAVPIRARGATLGVATLVRHRRPDPFEDDDLVLAEEIVARAAVCVDNARLYTRERATALTLQRSLLPQRLPGQAAVDVA
uniref:PAS domain-containing protein n=1 Tax=Frankia sp. Cppng1_Ct_nod TaxID=2897162 RepID=UPI0020242365